MKEIDRSVFKSHFRRGYDGRWVETWDTDVLHPGDVFITVHDEVWEVGVRDLDGRAMVKKMTGVSVRRGVAILTQGSVLFNRLHGEQAAEVKRDYEAKLGRLFNSEAGSDGKQ